MHKKKVGNTRAAFFYSCIRLLKKTNNIYMHSSALWFPRDVNLFCACVRPRACACMCLREREREREREIGVGGGRGKWGGGGGGNR